MIDRGSEDHRTVSEGQAYAMFFALVVNDRETFERLLNWTQNNLADGDLTVHLPAWLWGQNKEGDWQILDDNSATDADLWLAYSLLEAGRLWQVERYSALGELIASRILSEVMTDLPGLGPVLLPAPVGFADEPGQWRLNPSYTPPQILLRLSSLFPNSPWPQLERTNWVFLEQAALDGYPPDWVLFSADTQMQRDLATGGIGSYDAIRVFLWLGMLGSHHEHRDGLSKQFGRMLDFVEANSFPPEIMKPNSDEGVGPPGFSAALLPLLAVQGRSRQLRAQELRVMAFEGWPSAYYQQALRFFGQGWSLGAIRFGPDGRFVPNWKEGC